MINMLPRCLGCCPFQHREQLSQPLEIPDYYVATASAAHKGCICTTCPKSVDVTISMDTLIEHVMDGRKIATTDLTFITRPKEEKVALKTFEDKFRDNIGIRTVQLERQAYLEGKGLCIAKFRFEFVARKSMIFEKPKQAMYLSVNLDDHKRQKDISSIFGPKTCVDRFVRFLKTDKESYDGVTAQVVAATDKGTHTARSLIFLERTNETFQAIMNAPYYQRNSYEELTTALGGFRGVMQIQQAWLSDFNTQYALDVIDYSKLPALLSSHQTAYQLTGSLLGFSPESWAICLLHSQHVLRVGTEGMNDDHKTDVETTVRRLRALRTIGRKLNVSTYSPEYRNLAQRIYRAVHDTKKIVSLLLSSPLKRGDLPFRFLYELSRRILACPYFCRDRQHLVSKGLIDESRCLLEDTFDYDVLTTQFDTAKFTVFDSSVFKGRPFLNSHDYFGDIALKKVKKEIEASSGTIPFEVDARIKKAVEAVIGPYMEK